MTLQDYISLFPGASREKPKFMALAEAVIRQVTDLLPVTSALISGFSLSSAVGIQLDQIAASWGLTKADTAYGSGATDGQFRAFLTAKLAQWQWDGTNARGGQSAGGDSAGDKADGQSGRNGDRDADGKPPGREKGGSARADGGYSK